MSKPCGCGLTKDPSGNCDGSHKSLTPAKSIPFDKITIRVMSHQNQKVKFVFPSIANNKGLMRNMGFVISDPNYDAKMEAIRNRKPFSENGKAPEPAKESFAPPVEAPKPEVKIEQPKGESVLEFAERKKAQDDFASLPKPKRAYKKRATKTETNPTV